MKLKITSQNIYLLLISFVLLVAMLLFAFMALIPAGKEYRSMSMKSEKHARTLMQSQQRHDKILARLKALQDKNREVFTAYENSFVPDQFIKANHHNFEDMKISMIERTSDEVPFAVYEVNTSLKIASPRSFYNFLEEIQKSDWIIGVNFPISFKRDDDFILTSFTMKVYSLADKTEER